MATQSPDRHSAKTIKQAAIIRCLLGACLLLGGLGLTFAGIRGHDIIFFYGAVVMGAILIMQGFGMFFEVEPRKPIGSSLPDSVPALIYIWIAMGVAATAGTAYLLLLRFNL